MSTTDSTSGHDATPPNVQAAIEKVRQNPGKFVRSTLAHAVIGKVISAANFYVWALTLAIVVGVMSFRFVSAANQVLIGIGVPLMACAAIILWVTKAVTVRFLRKIGSTAHLSHIIQPFAKAIQDAGTEADLPTGLFGSLSYSWRLRNRDEFSRVTALLEPAINDLEEFESLSEDVVDDWLRSKLRRGKS